MGVLEVIQANPNKAVNLSVYTKESMCADKEYQCLLHDSLLWAQMHARVIST